MRGTRWHCWLRHCATSWKVAGSMPDGVIGIFHWHNPPSRTVALGLTQPLTGKSKGGRYVGLTTLPPLCAGCLQIWEPQPPGTLKACNGIALPFYTRLCAHVERNAVRIYGSEHKLEQHSHFIMLNTFPPYGFEGNWPFKVNLNLFKESVSTAQ